MTGNALHIKSPFLAGLLGVIPGCGHLYAGQKSKAILIWLFLFTTLMIGFSGVRFWSFPSGNFSFLSMSEFHYEYHLGNNNFSIYLPFKNLMIPSFLIAIVIACILIKPKKETGTLLMILLCGFIGMFLIHAVITNLFTIFFSNRYLPMPVMPAWSPASIGIFLFLISILILYSIADSAISVVHHNRRVMFGNMEPEYSQNLNQPLNNHYWSGNTEQDALRQGARERGISI